MKHIKIILIFLTNCFLIKAYGQDTILVPTQKPNIKQGCYTVTNNGVITSEEEFKSKVIKLRSFDILGCQSFGLPEINFSVYNLLWFDLNIGGAYLGDVYLYKIPSQKKYFFVINTWDSVTYTTAVSHTFNIRELTAKFESDYHFEYKIEKHYK